MITLVETINDLDGGRIREAEDIRAQTHNIAMPSMKVDMGMLRASAKVVYEAPPVRVSGEPMSWVLVKTIVQLVVQQPSEKSNTQDDRPVCQQHREDLGGQHAD